MEVERLVTPTDKCKGKAHYWVLDEKNFGICKKCGITRQFPSQGYEWQKRNIVVGKNLRSTTD